MGRPLTPDAERLRQEFAEAGIELTPEEMRLFLNREAAHETWGTGSCAICGLTRMLRGGICAECFADAMMNGSA